MVAQYCHHEEQLSIKAPPESEENGNAHREAKGRTEELTNRLDGDGGGHESDEKSKYDGADANRNTAAERPSLDVNGSSWPWRARHEGVGHLERAGGMMSHGGQIGRKRVALPRYFAPPESETLDSWGSEEESGGERDGVRHAASGH